MRLHQTPSDSEHLVSVSYPILDTNFIMRNPTQVWHNFLKLQKKMETQLQKEEKKNQLQEEEI